MNNQSAIHNNYIVTVTRGDSIELSAEWLKEAKIKHIRIVEGQFGSKLLMPEINLNDVESPQYNKPINNTGGNESMTKYLKTFIVEDPMFGAIKYFGETPEAIELRERETSITSRRIIRIFTNPVSLKDACDHQLDKSKYTRFDISGKSTLMLLKEVLMKGKVVKTYDGPNGTVRYRDVKTGKFVSKK